MNGSGVGTITFGRPFEVQSVALFTNRSVNFAFNNLFTFGAAANFAAGSGDLTSNSDDYEKC